MPFVLPVLADLHEYIERVAVVEGYNTNTYQSQDNPSLPVLRRHPSPFTGLEGDVEARDAPNSTDLYTLRIGGRVMHYEPLVHEDQSDDAAAYGAVSARWALAERTILNLSADGEVATLNGAHLADMTILGFDPTLFRRTYWLDTEEVSITHQASKTWRMRQSLGVITAGTLYQPPTQLPSGQLTQHRGLDYVTPYLETDLDHDFSERFAFDSMLLYQYSYNVYVLDLTQNPPRNIGPDKTAFLTALPGFSWRFAHDWTEVLHVGGVLASAPPRDLDQRPIISPAANDELYYTATFWTFIAGVSYTYGTVNPRLGAGPSVSGSMLLMGTPSRVGNWKNFDIMVNAQASYSSLVTGANLATNLGLYAADAEIRYALSPWLGLLGGYQARYATYSAPGQQYLPPFAQSIVFVGLSGYWSTDRNIPPLTTVVAPVTPPT
jgi:hypothetical protein